MASEETMQNGRNFPAAVRLALVYLGTGFAVFLLMGLLGLLMRLGQSGMVAMPAEWFYIIMTLHGSAMTAASLLAGMGGLIAVLSRYRVLPLRWLWLAFYLYFMGAGFVILATLVGRFGAGWTVLHPLPYMGTWSLWAAVAMYLGYLFVALGFLVYCLVMLYVTMKAHGGLGGALAWGYLFSGGRRKPESLPKPAELVATVVGIDGVITVVAGAILLVPLFAQAAGLIGMVDALFAKNLLFLFGHTLVNLNIYVSAALVYTMMPHYTKREWKTTVPVALALNLVIVLVLLPYFHHLYQDFAQPLALHILGQIGSYAVALPAFLVTIFGGLTIIHRSGIRWTVAPMFVAFGLWGWTLGGLGAILDSTIGVNQVMHNTMWVPAHFHSYYVMGAVAFTIGYFYHLLQEFSGQEEPAASRVAAWLYGIGGAGFLLMFFFSGAFSVPRRYAEHPASQLIWDQVSVAFVLMMAAGIAWLTLDVAGRLKVAWRQTRRSKGQEGWAPGISG